MKRLLAFACIISLMPLNASAQNAERPVGVLVFGDSNTWGWEASENGFPVYRYRNEHRFPGIIAERLGDGFRVSANGLNNRTTDVNEVSDWNGIPPSEFNGLAEIASAVAVAAPIDLVVIMLGTNDLKAVYGRTPTQIAEGARAVADKASTSTGVATLYGAPKVLVVTPPPLGDMNHEGIAGFFAGGKEKSSALPPAFETTFTETRHTLFHAVDAMGVIDGYDGIHFSLEDHRQLGHSLAERIKAIVSER